MSAKATGRFSLSDFMWRMHSTCYNFNTKLYGWGTLYEVPSYNGNHLTSRYFMTSPSPIFCVAILSVTCIRKQPAAYLRLRSACRNSRTGSWWGYNLRIHCQRDWQSLSETRGNPRLRMIGTETPQCAYPVLPTMHPPLRHPATWHRRNYSMESPHRILRRTFLCGRTCQHICLLQPKNPTGRFQVGYGFSTIGRFEYQYCIGFLWDGPNGSKLNGRTINSPSRNWYLTLTSPPDAPNLTVRSPQRKSLSGTPSGGIRE